MQDTFREWCYPSLLWVSWMQGTGRWSGHYLTETAVFSWLHSCLTSSTKKSLWDNACRNDVHICAGDVEEVEEQGVVPSSGRIYDYQLWRSKPNISEWFFFWRSILFMNSRPHTRTHLHPHLCETKIWFSCTFNFRFFPQVCVISVCRMW